MAGKAVPVPDGEIPQPLSVSALMDDSEYRWNYDVICELFDGAHYF